MQGGRYAQAGFGIAIDSMHDDRPGMCASGYRPGRHRPELAGDAHIGVRQPQGLSRVARVYVGVEGNLHSRHQVAALGAQPSRHRAGIAAQDFSDDRMPSLPVESVYTGSLGGFGSRHDDSVG